MIKVIKPGALSQLQDLGRYGYQRYGVPVNGVMDEASHRIANILVGNGEHEATLECTLTGPSLQFTHDRLVALCGADMQARIDDVAAPLGQPLLVRAGATLYFGGGGHPSAGVPGGGHPAATSGAAASSASASGARRKGARVYLAVRGGFGAQPVMGSASTFARGGFGGLHGRPLAKGDRIELPAADAGYPGATRLLVQCGTPCVSAAQFNLPRVESSMDAVRVVLGPQWDRFTADARAAFLAEPFEIGGQSDRMGYRLRGSLLKLEQAFEMVSEAVSFGTVQVPPDGNPIILMADRQSAGGYPKIAYVASVDLPMLAQAMPGDQVRFALVTLNEAQALYLQREAALAALRSEVQRAMQPAPAAAMDPLTKESA